MIKNYFLLNRFIIESATYINGSRLIDAFSQEKDKIIFTINKGQKDLFIEINTNPGFPFITIKDNFHRAKKNTINFFSDYIPSSFANISIATADRIIKLSFTNFSIYFAIRGKFTNVILIDNSQNAIPFKKIDQEELQLFIDEVRKIKFTNKENYPDLKAIDDLSSKEKIKNKYPFIGNEIIFEYMQRMSDSESNLSILNKVIKSAFTEYLSVLINTDNTEMKILPTDFYKDNFNEIKNFDNVIDAFNYYIQKSYYLNEFNTKLKKIKKYLDRELIRLSSKLNNLKTQLNRKSREEEYNKTGNLLLLNLNSIKKGMKEIEVDDVYQESASLKISLDPLLSPKQNVEKYFSRSRNEKIILSKSKQIFNETEKKYFRLKSLNELLDSKLSLKQLNEIMKELKIKEDHKTETKDDLSDKFKQYFINNKYRVFVGKDSKNNDLLTTKFARQNDYWFHARSVSGSHVVLRVDSTKEVIPKDILKKAASLAAYHSKAKTAGVVPVSYCLKKYVVKKKGMPAGQVVLLKESTLLVKPEIPPDSEFISNNLD